MKRFSIHSIHLDFNSEDMTLSPESAGCMVVLDDALIVLKRYALRGLQHVWYYVKLGENEEHYTSRLSNGSRLKKYVFVQGIPGVVDSGYSGRVQRSVVHAYGRGRDRRDPIIPIAEAERYVNLLQGDRGLMNFVSSLFEYDIEAPIVNGDKFVRIKQQLGAQECTICGRLHARADCFCSACAEQVSRYATILPDGRLMPTAFLARLEGDSQAPIPVWEAMNRMVICPVCGTPYKFTGGVHMCATCASKIKTCCLCGEKIRASDSSISVEGVGDFHPHCAHKPVMTGYHNNESHSSPKFYGTPPVEKFPLFMGIELEGAGKRESEQMPLMAEKIVRTKLADLKVEATRDGSLPGGGIEIISQPMTIEMWRDTMPRWKETLGLLTKHAKIYGHDAKVAGLHVHVSKKAFQMYEPLAADPEFRDRVAFGRLIVLFARFQDEFLFISRRNKDRKSEYARTLVSHSDFASLPDDRFRVEFARLREKALSSSGHYTELNISPSNTLEFRLFRSTFNTETLLATLEFVHGLCWFVANNDMDRCRTVSFDDLIAFIDKPILTAYVERVMARRSRTQDDGFEGE